MKIYFGWCSEPLPVRVKRLDAGHRVEDLPHVPCDVIGKDELTWFGWGQRTPAAARLALALLKDATGSTELAAAHVFAFRDEVVARWAGETWIITEDEILNWVDGRVAQRPHGHHRDLNDVDN